MPVLYLVSTPIGNLEDVTMRALRILGEVGIIAAEDTRTTRKLLTRYGIRGRLMSYHHFSGEGRTQGLARMLATQDVALVSEAGTPNVSDPGYPLVRAALQQGFSVVPVPGPSAVIAAVAVSGLPTDRFVYLGFLPRRAGERRSLFESLLQDPRTVVAFESPHRLRKTLEDLDAVLGERPLVLCREMTKVYEEVFRGDAAEALAHFVRPRGEFTLVLGGSGFFAADYWQGQRPKARPRAVVSMAKASQA